MRPACASPHLPFTPDRIFGKLAPRAMSGEQRTAGAGSAAVTGTVTIVTQTRVRPESAEAFARWQEETSAAIAAFPGFIKQTVMPPSPPAQVDWVILQRFADTEAAMAWLQLGASGSQRMRRRGADAGRPRRRPPRAATAAQACCPRRSRR